MPWLVIVAAFFGFSALRKMLEFLGLAQSKDTAGLDASSTNPGSFWNPNFWKQVLPAGAKYTYALTIAQAQELAKRIYDSTGFLHHDAPAMKAVFKSLQTQANASFLAWVFAEVYGEDLLSWLRGRWFEPYRYSDADVNEVTNFVNNLRKY